MGFLPTHRGRRSTPQRSSATPSHPERQRRGEGKEEWERRTKPYNSELDIGLPLRNRRLELFRAAALANDEDTVISLVALDPGKVSYMYPIRIHGLHLYYSIRTLVYFVPTCINIIFSLVTAAMGTRGYVDWFTSHTLTINSIYLIYS